LERVTFSIADNIKKKTTAHSINKNGKHN
jgi:hypothetical protein